MGVLELATQTLCCKFIQWYVPRQLFARFQAEKRFSLLQSCRLIDRPANLAHRKDAKIAARLRSLRKYSFLFNHSKRTIRQQGDMQTRIQ